MSRFSGNSSSDQNAVAGAVVGPLVVHCSAGVGRTGTLLALDILSDMAHQESRQVDVLGVLNHLRRQRPLMVQTADQYEFIYLSLQELHRHMSSRATTSTSAVLLRSGSLTPQTASTMVSGRRDVDLDLSTRGSAEETLIDQSEPLAEPPLVLPLKNNSLRRGSSLQFGFGNEFGFGYA